MGSCTGIPCAVGENGGYRGASGRTWLASFFWRELKVVNPDQRGESYPTQQITMVMELWLHCLCFAFSATVSILRCPSEDLQVHVCSKEGRSHGLLQNRIA